MGKHIYHLEGWKYLLTMNDCAKETTVYFVDAAYGVHDSSALFLLLTLIVHSFWDPESSLLFPFVHALL
jgi:hypothetical protein